MTNPKQHINENLASQKGTAEPDPPIELDPCETQADLERLCREWQQRLRLTNWRVRIRWANYGDMDCQGDVSYNPDHPDARIRIQPLDSKSSFRDPLEKTIIHELLHLHHWWLSQSNGANTTEVENTMLEQTIDKTAWALLELKYGADVWDLDSYMIVETGEDQ